MANLPEIKERLSATQDTKKITQSLELVAASKMKGFVKKALASRSFAASQYGAMKRILSSISDAEFTQKRTQGKTVFVLLSSDKGLCGSLNARISKNLFESDEWKSTPLENRLVIVVGKKGVDIARRKGVVIHKSFTGIGENITPLSALAIIDPILELWKSGEARAIYLVSLKYESPFLQKALIRPYLPFSPENFRSMDAYSESEDHLDSLIEPDLEKVTHELSFQVISSLFLQAFYELKASEYSSRMVAMKKASDSAQEMIQTLTLEYNKVRQSIITSQLSELAAAAEAMNEEEEDKPVEVKLIS